MNTLFTKLLAIIGLFCVLLSCEDEIAKVPITGMNLSETSLVLKVDSVANLTVNIEPKAATHTNFQWFSSDTTIATVSNDGVVYGIAPGESTIIVKNQAGVSDTSRVNVIKVSINETNDKINFGGECIALDNDGNLWYGGSGLYKMESESWKQVLCPFHTYISAIEFDSENNLWAATQTMGLLKFDGQTWSNLDTINSNIPANFLNSIAIDNDDNIWVGINKELRAIGVAKYDGSTWQTYNMDDGLIYNLAWNMVADQQNNIWVATLKGVSMFDGTLWNSFSTGESLDIEVDKENNMWVASNGNGVFKYDGSNLINYNSSNSPIFSDYIKSIGIGTNGTMWFGLSDGVTKFNGEEWTHFLYQDCGIYDVRSIEIDSEGNKWFGTPFKIFKLEDE